MSLEAAGEFWLEMQANAETTERADNAYLDAVRAIATEQGYEVTNDELRDSLRAIAGLDDDDAEGFGLRSFRPAPVANTIYVGGSFGGAAPQPFDTIYGGEFSLPRFSPLGFLR